MDSPTLNMQKCLDKIQKLVKNAPKLPDKREPIYHLSIWHFGKEYGVTYLDLLSRRHNAYTNANTYTRLQQLGFPSDNDARYVHGNSNITGFFITTRTTMVNWVQTFVICVVLEPHGYVYDVPYEHVFEHLDLFTMN